MTIGPVEQILHQVETLSAEERRVLRGRLDALPDPNPYDELDRRLMQAGLIGGASFGRPGNRGPNPQPLRIEGPPLSQTIIEERR